MLFVRIAAEEPTILILDDLHWADATTLTALQFMQRRWGTEPFGIITAGRPALMETMEPAAKYLECSEELPVKRIDLHQLTMGEGRCLVGHLLGPQVDEHVCDRICELGGLHPLYLTELSKDLAAGRLSLPSLPVDDVTVPVSLQEIFRSRVRLLSPTALKVSGLLAARGKAMRLTQIARLTGLPIELCADCAEELLDLRLVELDQDRVWVANELFRSALYQHLSEARKAVLHRAIAEHLSTSAADGSNGELAIHYARAGEREHAAFHGWIAAAKAVENGALAEAAYLFDLVVANEDDAARLAEATAELARALHLSRAIARANPVLELAAVRLRQTGNSKRALRMDIRRVEGLSEAGSAPVGDVLGRLVTIKEEARRSRDLEALALALDVELHIRHHAGDLRGVRDVFDEMRAVTRAGDKVASAIAHSGLALGILFGDVRPALTSARKAVSECEGRTDQRLRSLLRLLLVLQYQGRFHSEEARSLVEEARELSKTSGDLLLRFSLESNIAVAHLDAGELDAAEISMMRSSRMLGSAELDLNRFNQANNAGELALAMGDYTLARRWFHTAATYVGGKTPLYAPDMVRAGLGLCALATGDLRQARNWRQT